MAGPFGGIVDTLDRHARGHTPPPEDLAMADAWHLRRIQWAGAPERRELMALWGRGVGGSQARNAAVALRKLADAIDAGESTLNFCEVARGSVGLGAFSLARQEDEDTAVVAMPSGRYYIAVGWTDKAERAAAIPALEDIGSKEAHPNTAGWPREPWRKLRLLQDVLRSIPREWQDIVEFEYQERLRSGNWPDRYDGEE